MIKHKTQYIPLESVLIVSEDTKSSVNYFEDKIKDLQLKNCKAINITAIPSYLGTSPDKVIESAIKESQFFNKEAQKKGLLPYTTVYALIDTDDWDKKIDEAKNIAEDNTNIETKYFTIVSNECFEVWYILHFKDYADIKPIYRPKKGKLNKMIIDNEERTDKLMEKFLGKTYNKADEIYDLLKEKGNELNAIKNAEYLAQYHSENSTNGNPSTDVYIVVKHLNELSKTFLQENNINDTSDILLPELIENYSVTDAFKMGLIILINEIYKDESKENKLTLCNNILNKPIEVANFTNNESIMNYIFQNEEIY